jgi:AcrR family transcriptional regulator
MSRVVAIDELPRHFVVHNRHELIQVAAARVVAAKGYDATTVEDICAEAEVSTKTFYEHFSGKQETVLTAVEAGVDQLMADLQETVMRAESWAEGMWECLSAITDWMSCEPEFARTTVVELLKIGAPGLELLRSLLDALALFMEPGYELLQGMTPGTLDEPITWRVFELVYDHLTHNPAETSRAILPDVARITLTPFIGPAAAEDLIDRREVGARA